MNFDEFIQQLSEISTVEIAIYGLGLGLLVIWFVKTSFGIRSLAGSTARRNNMPFYIPFLILFIWFAIITIIISVSHWFFGNLPDWQNAFLDNLVLCIGAMISMVVIIFLVRRYFVRGLKGFGLNIKTIPRDFGVAFLNLFSVYPLVSLALGLTMYFGHLIWGPDFQLEQHQELEILILHEQLPLRVLVIITAAVIVPIFEEMLFRGIFQTTIRSYVEKPWIAILVTAFIFAMVHYNKEHWPALFVLGACLGYAYEKRGSLFRSIFVHSLFNTTSLIVALNQ
jgi:membrane protease YdiL (CAAX protease family)